jgi:hypothetical protein
MKTRLLIALMFVCSISFGQNVTGNYVRSRTVYYSDTTYTPTGTEPTGTSYWDKEEGSFSDVLENGVIGQRYKEIFATGQNNTGVTIQNGTPIMYAGSIGNSGNVRIKPASFLSTTPVLYFIGVATSDIPNDSVGNITTYGKVRGIQTDGANYGETWTDSTIIYPINGGWTKVVPEAPIPAIPAAVVISAHPTNGTILVRPELPQRLTDLADVNGTPLTETGQFPVWDNARRVFDFNYKISNEVYSETWDGEDSVIATFDNLRDKFFLLETDISTNQQAIIDSSASLQGQIDLNTTHRLSDNDLDNTNELQTISKVGSTVTLSNGGGSFTDEVDDADNSITNELQNLSLGIQSGTSIPVNISSGTGVTINVADNDNDPNNEIQDISGIAVNADSITAHRSDINQNAYDIATLESSSHPLLTKTGTGTYVTLNEANQILTVDQINLTTDVTGLLPDGNIASASAWNAKQDALTAGNQLSFSGNTLNVLDGSGSGLDADLFGGYNSLRYTHRSFYNASSGLLVQTDIPYPSETMFTMEVTANGYSGDEKINISTQGYVYSTLGTILESKGIADNYNETIYYQIRGGYLYIWFPVTASYQTFNVEVFAGNSSESTINRAVNVSSSEKPTDASIEVSFVPDQRWHSGNFDPSTKQDLLIGNESIFNGWDKNVSDDFSGDYNDLLNKPTIPTVNNSTITLQRNGLSIGNFTLNQTTNETFNFIDENTQLSQSQVNSYESDPTVLTYTKSLTSASKLLTEIKTVDGAGSGLDADLLGGQFYTNYMRYDIPQTYGNDIGDVLKINGRLNINNYNGGLRLGFSDGTQTTMFVNGQDGAGDNALIVTRNASSNYAWNFIGTVSDIEGNSTQWNDAYNNKITSASVTGTTTKTITLNQQDGGTITTSFTDLQGATGTGVSGRVSYWNSTTNITSDADFTFDGLNLRVGATNGTGNVNSGNFTLTSDKRLKRNIAAIDDLSIYDDIEFVQFKMKADGKYQRYGVIAQDLEKINSNLVRKDKDGYYSVAYIDLLIAKTARQDEQIKELNEKVEKLTKLVEELMNEK